MHWTRTTAIALLGLGCAWLAWAQSDTVQVKRATDLRQSPSETAPSVAPLAAQANLTRLPERQGPWMRVKTETGQTGWVHMFDVGTAASASAANASSSSGSGALRGITSLFSKPTQQTTATSTIGIRGLGAEDLTNAQPNAAAVTQMEGLRTDVAQAKRFAADSQLTARDVEALPAPAAPATASPLPASQR